MELTGEETRIRALFSQVRQADEQTAPSFAGVWNRAQSKTVRTTRVFNLSFAAASALLVCGLVSLAWWSTHRPQHLDVVIVSAPPIASPAVKVVEPAKNPEPVKITQHRFVGRSLALKLAARRQAGLVAAGKKTLRDAKAIASWQSPTATLLASPSDELLKSLPQLTQTAEELKLFLRDQLNSQPK
ncbi:MAG: hypothetical protein QOI77_2905 [Blastocatellia bacterium]|jgi:hypothetical protein|nr:hypothetical protein [Blastocatellia bacterium]